jgi:hypothetical protein
MSYDKKLENMIISCLTTKDIDRLKVRDYIYEKYGINAMPGSGRSLETNKRSLYIDVWEVPDPRYEDEDYKGPSVTEIQEEQCERIRELIKTFKKIRINGEEAIGSKFYCIGIDLDV